MSNNELAREDVQQQIEHMRDRIEDLLGQMERLEHRRDNLSEALIEVEKAHGKTREEVRRLEGELHALRQPQKA